MLLRKLFVRRIYRYLLLLDGALLVFLALAIAFTPPPRRELKFDGATIHIEADRAWVLLPRQCVNVLWEMERIQSLYINGQGKPISGAMVFCPTFNSIALEFDIRAENGALRTEDLIIQDLSAAILSCAALLTLLLPLLIALYYLATPRFTERILLDASPVLALLALLLVCLIILTARPFTIEDVVNSLAYFFISATWQGIGIALGALVFIPLAGQSLRLGLQRGSRADFVALGTFLVLIIFLYAPFGIDSIGQSESWTHIAYFEGRPTKLAREAVARFWIYLPDFSARLISSNSFVGFHLLYLFMLFGKSVLLYAILRRLKIAHLIAFIFSILVLVYPVNSDFMNLRSTPHAFSKLALLISIYYVLDFRDNPSRSRLLGVWLSLLFCVASYQNAFVIIALIPILWWWRRPRLSWSNFNLTVVWALIPAAQLIYTSLLANAGWKYYGATYLTRTLRQERSVFEIASNQLEVIAKVYLETFAHGWREALNHLSHNEWIAPALAALLLVGIAAGYLTWQSSASMFPSSRQSVIGILGGLFFILPAIAVMMWFEKYQSELWRMYIYVPIGAAAVVISLLLLLVRPIKGFRYRQALVIAVTLLLAFPAFSRLFAQHAHFVNRANAKAKILMQIVEQAPAFEPDAELILMTKMSGAELSRKGVGELRIKMLDSASYILYGESRPAAAYMCILSQPCSEDDIAIRRGRLEDSTDFSNLVIFHLHDDLSVELLAELPPELGGSSNDSYDPGRLIDTSAPVPPRALTMLASARRG